jgi:hypothetical protein
MLLRLYIFQSQRRGECSGIPIQAHVLTEMDMKLEESISGII